MQNFSQIRPFLKSPNCPVFSGHRHIDTQPFSDSSSTEVGNTLYFQVYDNEGVITVDHHLKWSYLEGSYHRKKYTAIVPYPQYMSGNGTNVMYRVTNESSVLRKINTDIVRVLGTTEDMPKSFTAKQAIIITYDNVQMANVSMILILTETFKFQVVLATDNKVTYAILNYERLDYKPREPAFFQDFQTCTIKRRNFIADSDQRKLVESSNIGVEGKHVFLLSGTVGNCSGNKGTELSNFLLNPLKCQ